MHFQIKNPIIFINKYNCFIWTSIFKTHGMIILESQVLALLVIGTNVGGESLIINLKHNLTK